MLDNTAHQLQPTAGWEPPAGLLGLHGGHHRSTTERAFGRSCLLLGAGMAPVPAQGIESLLLEETLRIIRVKDDSGFIIS